MLTILAVIVFVVVYSVGIWCYGYLTARMRHGVRVEHDHEARVARVFEGSQRVAEFALYGWEPPKDAPQDYALIRRPSDDGTSWHYEIVRP